MRGQYVHPEDFITLLANLPWPASEVHAYLAGHFGILSVRSDPAALWGAIVEQRGEEGAEDVVSALVLRAGGERLRKLIRAAAEDRDVHVRADDSAIVRQLFDADGLLTDLGHDVMDYWDRSGGDADSDEGEEAEEEEEEENGGTGSPPFRRSEAAPGGDPTDRAPNPRDLLLERPRSSAPPGTGWRLERVEPSLGKVLTVEAGWKEKDLEDFIWVQWGQMDFGLGGPLRLVGRQVQLKTRGRDRVDFLARGPAGEWVAIELKIVEAQSADFTQLLSYISDLSSRGIASGKVRGILIAPGFGAKVMNAAAADPRVTLLRFRTSAEG